MTANIGRQLKLTLPFPVCVCAEEEAEGVVGMRGVRSQVQPDVPPQGSSSDPLCRKRRHGRLVPLVSARRRRPGAALLTVREEVLFCDAPPQPRPEPALNQTGHRLYAQAYFYFEREQEVGFLMDKSVADCYNRDKVLLIID